MSELQLISDFLKNNNNISPSTKKFLLRYVVKKYSYGEVNKEQPYKVDVISIKEDIKCLIKKISTIEQTSLVILKMNKLLKLMDVLFEIKNEDDLYDLSYELDKLYLEFGMPIRNTDTIVRKLESFNFRKLER